MVGQNRKSRNFMLAFVLTISMLVLAACSSGGGSSKGTIDVTETDYKIQLSAQTAPAGSVTFNVKNSSGSVTHDFVILKTDLSGSQLPTDSNGNVDESKLTKVGTVTVDPGASQTLTVTLDAGHYAVVCDEPGHFQQGMYADFTVQ